jgi:hypothetical protein
MKVHLSRPESGFTIIPDAVLRDPKLSFQARGVLAELLSRPDDWETTADSMSRYAKAKRGEAGEGRDQLRAAFTELERADYLHRERRRGGRGRFTTVLHIFDTPDLKKAWLAAEEFKMSVDNLPPEDVSAGRTDDETGSRRSGLGKGASSQVAPTTDLPGVGQPGVGRPGVGQPGVLTKTDNEDLRTKTLNEDHDEDRVGVLTSPVPVEGANGRSGQKRFSDEEWAERERIAARQVGPLPEVAP